MEDGTMRKVYMILMLLLTVSVASAQQKELFVLHTSDTHSRIEPLEPTSADRYRGMGGVARRSAYIKQMRELHPNLLLLDCGDISQGTPYYNMFQGELEIKCMNLMGYDAMTIGNHEFDFGMDNMARIFKMANFPIVCSNYDFKGTVLEKLVQPYIILKRDGMKIGIFGLSPELEGLVREANCKGVTFKDPATTANEMVKILRDKKKCDVVICLSHLGYDYSDTPEKYSDNVVFTKTHGIDLVLGGHSHSYMEAPVYLKDAEGKTVTLFHTGRNGTFVGTYEMTLTKK
jgi:5'-nucleotidase